MKNSNLFLKKCLICNSSNLRQYLDLGVQPLANSYVEKKNIELEKFPLGLNLCESCWHSQLTYNVDRKYIFDNYHYASGTSNTLIKYFNWLAKSLKKTLNGNSKVLEIAANDGSLIKKLIDFKINAIGIDPAQNIVKEMNENNVKVILGYWPESSYKLKGKFDCILCLNVLAHVDNPNPFIQGCKDKLNSRGYILIQPSQARMIGNIEFDTCYHEHLSFFNLSSINQLATQNDLKLYASFLVRIHGDSPIYILGHKKYPPDVDKIINSFSSGDFFINENLSDYEKSINLYSFDTYKKFSDESKKIIKSFENVIKEYKMNNYKIAFVGAAAKAMTIINSTNIEPDYFYDEAKMKVNMYPPGINIRIDPLTNCSQLNSKTLFIITAWNFKNELIEKIKKINPSLNSKFFTYFPKPEFHT
tara:strand:+ start:2024 stop:3274 length:1251 start_codon:yes stop_codon:yes gene_type:complete